MSTNAAPSLNSIFYVTVRAFAAGLIVAGNMPSAFATDANRLVTEQAVKCWNPPPKATADVWIHVEVDLSTDGRVLDGRIIDYGPKVDANRGAAESAERAVRRCAPYILHGDSGTALIEFSRTPPPPFQRPYID